MQFLYPSFLFALCAVLIPILIHLFSFRRYKKILFSDIRFLQQIEEQNKSRQKLRDLLILFCRILSIVLMVLAFAQPFIPRQQNTVSRGQKTVSLYIDNSFSMLNEGGQGNLFEEARNKARDIINAYDNNTRFQVLSNDFEARDQRLVSRTDALQHIDELRISGITKKISTVYKRQLHTLLSGAEGYRAVFLISDLQHNAADLDKAGFDSTVSVNIVRLEAARTHNLYIDSAWLQSPVLMSGEQARIRVRVGNSSSEDEENITLTLMVNGVQKALQTIDCPANGTGTTELVFTPAGSWQNGEISLTDHPVVFDDKLFFSVKPREQNHILSINGAAENDFVNRLFRDDPAYSLTNQSQQQIDYSKLGSYELVILNEPVAIATGLAAELIKYAENGGHVFVVPAASDKDLGSLNTLLAQLKSVQLGPPVSVNAIPGGNAGPLKVDQLNTTDLLFRNVFSGLPKNPDLPRVQLYYPLVKNNATRGRMVMQLNNGDVFLWQSSAGKGRVDVLATPLREAWTNLPMHAIFVPLMLRSAIGISNEAQLYYVAGIDEWIRCDARSLGTEKLVHIRGKETELAAAQQQGATQNEIYIDHQLKLPGFYTISPQAAKEVLGAFAINYDRMESEMKFMDEATLERTIAGVHNSRIYDTADNMQARVTRELKGTELWRWCILLCLVFILTEILLLRLMKA